MARSSDPVVLAAGLRLPQARAGVAFAREDAAHLGARVARELLARTGLDPAELDEVIVGCVGPPHDQANVARVIALRAGVPRPVPAQTVARNCASGMQAVTTAVTKIEAGRGDLFLCLGVEVMSAYPLLFNRRAVGFFSRLARARSLGARLKSFLSFRPAMLAPRIAITEGLTDPTTGLLMGSTAELLAREFGITRVESDAFALESHRRAKAARESGRLAREIVPHLPIGAGGVGGAGGAKNGALEHDDGIRDDQSMKALSKLKPYFERPDGVVTVGNACQVTDGATALLVTTRSRASRLGLTPLAAVRSFAWSGCDPERMGLGPVYSSAKALEEAGCELADIGAVEVNEAFATQVLACQKAFDSAEFAEQHLGRSRALGELSPEKTNVNGGAIAIGHPVGATGARLLLTVAHELAVGDHELGLATLCIGGGQGGAVVLEHAS
ncbi:MAG: acetyl-CoA C-acyltransferase [Planctomycetota bacterium]|nr:acetyl-CoA C-acyltransferase [Planctomycetota bacterium]